MPKCALRKRHAQLRGHGWPSAKETRLGSSPAAAKRGRPPQRGLEYASTREGIYRPVSNGPVAEHGPWPVCAAAPPRQAPAPGTPTGGEHATHACVQAESGPRPEANALPNIWCVGPYRHGPWPERGECGNNMRRGTLCRKMQRGRTGQCTTRRAPPAKPTTRLPHRRVH